MQGDPGINGLIGCYRNSKAFWKDILLIVLDDRIDLIRCVYQILPTPLYDIQRNHIFFRKARKAFLFLMGVNYFSDILKKNLTAHRSANDGIPDALRCMVFTTHAY